MGAALLSGLSGAITQRTLQRSGRNASQLSLELAVYGVMAMFITAGLGLSSAEGWASGGLDSFFRGWTSWTWLPVLSQAAGGLVVGQVLLIFYCQIENRKEQRCHISSLKDYLRFCFSRGSTLF